MRLGADGAAFCRNILLFDEGTSLSSSAKGLAGRYAGALYALAEEAGKVDAVVADMTGLAELVSGNDEMKTLVGSLAISWT
ncbi:MAG: F0F1 ATP synthase subunit delta, partial [Candidatus Puniceispirillaceae bacterium]